MNLVSCRARCSIKRELASVNEVQINKGNTIIFSSVLFRNLVIVLEKSEETIIKIENPASYLPA